MIGGKVEVVKEYQRQKEEKSQLRLGELEKDSGKDDPEMSKRELEEIW